MKHISLAKIKSLCLLRVKPFVRHLIEINWFYCSPLPSQVDIIQQVINSVSLLLEIDKRIHRGENILDLLP